tara:strand:- start:151 stop:435 length:285 start_codon:yes stop_codon:yes gene_type:complete
MVEVEVVLMEDLQLEHLPMVYQVVLVVVAHGDMLQVVEHLDLLVLVVLQLLGLAVILVVMELIPILVTTVQVVAVVLVVLVVIMFPHLMVDLVV